MPYFPSLCAHISFSLSFLLKIVFYWKWGATHRSKKKVLHLLKLGVTGVVGYHVRARIRTWVFCKTSKCSQALSQLSSPSYFLLNGTKTKDLYKLKSLFYKQYHIFIKFPLANKIPCNTGGPTEQEGGEDGKARWHSDLTAVCEHGGTHVEDRGQHVGVRSLFTMGSQTQTQVTCTANTYPRSFLTRTSSCSFYS